MKLNAIKYFMLSKWYMARAVLLAIKARKKPDLIDIEGGHKIVVDLDSQDISPHYQESEYKE